MYICMKTMTQGTMNRYTAALAAPVRLSAAITMVRASTTALRNFRNVSNPTRTR